MTASRVLATGIATALALNVGGLAGCAGSDSRPAPSASPTPTMRPSAELSATNPRAQFRVEGDGDARVVRVVIVTNINPDRQAVMLSVAVNGITTGGISPFPADQRGSFTVSLAPAAAEAIKNGGAVVEVKLAPIATGESLRSDLHMRVQAYIE